MIMTTDTPPSNGHETDPVLRALHRLPRDIEPRRDLWPRIAAGIEQPAVPARAPTRWVYAIAAALGCMALGGLLTYAALERRPDALPSEPALAGTNAPVRLVGASFGEYTALGPEYERARAALAIGLSERLDRLPPAERLKVERNLAEIRRALREINTALALQPNSTLLQELLLSTYQHELAILANVNQTAGRIPARTDT